MTPERSHSLVGVASISHVVLVSWKREQIRAEELVRAALGLRRHDLRRARNAAAHLIPGGSARGSL